MPNDIMTESTEDKALMEAIRTETTPPEPTPDPAPQPDPEPVVNRGALVEEREKRRALEREIADLKAKLSPGPQPANPEEDPIGALKETRGELAQLREFIAGQNAVAAFKAKVQPMLAAYQANHPEYAEQTAHLTQVRANQLKALGRPDAEIAQILRMEANAVFQAALESDRHPGEVVAELAKASGWAPKAAPAPAPNPTPAPAPAPSIKEAEERVERLQRGQRAATSSSQTGGASPAADEMSIEQIVNLNGAAFDAAVKKWESNEKAAGRWR